MKFFSNFHGDHVNSNVKKTDALLFGQRIQRNIDPLASFTRTNRRRRSLFYMSMIYSYWQHVVSWRLLACRKVQKALLPTRIYETCKAMKCQPVDICQIMLHCYIWQTPKKKARVRCTDHPSTRQTLFLCPCIRLFHFDRLRLGRWWKCRRTSQLRRNGRTKSSGRWTRTWTASSPLRSSLRSGYCF